MINDIQQGHQPFKFSPRGDKYSEQYAGGIILIYRSRFSGWDIEHRAESGRITYDWSKFKTKAIEYARARAEHFGARVFEEVV